jgi:hypothetical protein
MMDAVALINGAVNLSLDAMAENVKAKLDKIRQQEARWLLGISREMVDFGVGKLQPFHQYRTEPHRKKIMIELMALKDICFKNPELEKRRKEILHAVENALPLPADELDLFLISRVVPQILSREKQQEIKKYLDKNGGSN